MQSKTQNNMVTRKKEAEKKPNVIKLFSFLFKTQLHGTIHSNLLPTV